MKKEAFDTDTGLQCQAIIDNEGYCVKVKVLTKVPRGHYYSCLNEALLTAENLFKFRN
jgi:hypothetical protein